MACFVCDTAVNTIPKRFLLAVWSLLRTSAVIVTQKSGRLRFQVAHENFLDTLK